jgi:hypothetical protein
MATVSEMVIVKCDEEFEFLAKYVTLTSDWVESICIANIGLTANFTKIRQKSAVRAVVAKLDAKCSSC